MARKKRNKKKREATTSAPVAPATTKTGDFSFELTPPAPIFREDGTRDYYNEYYRAYKNDYIEQYLRAYREFQDINAAIEHVDKTTPPKK